MDKNSIVINRPVLRNDGVTSSIQFEIKGMHCESLFFSVDSNYESFLSDCADGALIALLAAAMEAGKNIHVAGTLSEKLLFNCNQYVIPLLVGAFSNLKKITVTADEARPAARPKFKGVVTGLSNGVDSLTVCADHLLRTAPDSLKITHFLFNDIGSHGAKLDPKSEEIFNERINGVENAAKLLSRPLIRIKSNLDYFYITPFFMTHSLRNAAVALILQAGVKSFLYASGVPYKNVRTINLRDICYLDPILLPLLSTESLTHSSSGIAYSRVEKTRLIADTVVAQKHLDVCVTEGHNCSTCWKCARTLYTLELLGKIDNFGNVFNLERYRSIRSGFIAHVFAARNKDPLCMEIYELLTSLGKSFSLSQRIHNLIAATTYKLAKNIPIWKLALLYQRVTYFSP